MIVACTTWGINPDTDSRFIKNGNSVVDALLTHYLKESDTFEHIVGAGSNGMATDQSCYALVAYDRLLNEQPALFDYSDVTFETVTPPATTDFSATLGLPENVENVPGTTFNGVISVNGWNNEAGYKLIDLIVDVPAGLSVTNVTAGNRLAGGALSYNLAEGKLRIVYFDANENSDLTTSGNSFPVELFNITFSVENVTVGNTLDIAISEMSLKLTSDSTNEDSKVDITTEDAEGSVTVVEGRTFSAGVLYQGDGVDLIPADKKAVVITVTKLEGKKKLTFNNGTTTVAFKYNAEISEKMGVTAYIALVDADMNMDAFENAENFTIDEADADSLTFGDINGDGVINAQDALLSLASCGGNYAEVDLRQPVPLSEDGVVEKELLDKIKNENAIATFTGVSGGLNYECKSQFAVDEQGSAAGRTAHDLLALRSESGYPRIFALLYHSGQGVYGPYRRRLAWQGNLS
ncbi:MAG: hypothetical protein E7605_02835 [Ruminococcaceae bacterium]|nr:hypothetical protein [Oscillospiraceae bacterium]